MRTISIQVISIVALMVACGTTGPGADDLNDKGTTGGTPSTGGSSGTDTGGTGVVTGGTSGAATGGSIATGGTGAPTGGTGATNTGGTGAVGTGGTDVVTGGTGGTDPNTGGTGTGGTDMPPTGGSGGSGMMTGGTGGAGMTGGTAGVGMTGGTGGSSTCTGPYCARTGSFKLLSISKTTGFRHDSIPQGKTMLQQIGMEQGFEVVITETTEEFTAAGLAKYEIVFFMNSTGDVLNNTEQTAYETWMTTKNGAYGGVHSGTDTENGWAFYSEVTGQYYDGHDNCCGQGTIQWDAAAAGHIAVRGLPSPWVRSEEWYHFDKAGTWAAKPGFQILSRITTNNNTRPVSYTREYGNFRSFYTSLGHQGTTFQDANVKKHVAAGIMWAVRREALFK